MAITHGMAWPQGALCALWFLRHCLCHLPGHPELGPRKTRGRGTPTTSEGDNASVRRKVVKRGSHLEMCTGFVFSTSVKKFFYKMLYFVSGQTKHVDVSS